MPACIGGAQAAMQVDSKPEELDELDRRSLQLKIELEALTSRTTRMRSQARNGIFMDSATATEIILQTERALGGT